MSASLRLLSSLLAAVASATVLALGPEALGEDLALRNDMPPHFEPKVAGADYVRTEVMIPMRDGVKLHTVVLSPRKVSQPVPIVLTRTPYNATKLSTRTVSPRLALTLPVGDETIAEKGYIRVYQDIRGKHKSEGIYVMTEPVRGSLNSRETDEVTDAYDTIDWLVHNVPGNNGHVGMIGTSYEAYLALMALLRPHPALSAVVPVNPMVDGWMGDDWFHLGAFRQVMIDYIYTQTTSPRSEFSLGHGYYDDYDFFLSGSSGSLGERMGLDQLPFWRLLTTHPNYDDFWKGQALDRLLEAQPHGVATMLVHSLFDQEDAYGALAAYRALTASTQGKNATYLVLGPWSHAPLNRDGDSLGHMRWDSSTAKYFREMVLQPFFERFLEPVEASAELRGSPPKVIAFDTGDHVWRHYESWPQSCTSRCAGQPQTVYLQSGHRLGFAGAPGTQSSFDEYVSDPGKPVPYRTRPIRPIYAAGSTWSEWLADDQRSFSDRTDVLTYTSEAISEPLTLEGLPQVTLRASTSGTDGDWIVKLIDVFPDEDAIAPELGGFQLMISSQILRGRFRNHFDHPEPIPANTIVTYVIPLPPVSHTLLPGHRLMVQIQSSWFPLYDRNPQQYVENIFQASAAQYRKATIRVYHDGRDGSSVALPVVGAHRNQF